VGSNYSSLPNGGTHLFPLRAPSETRIRRRAGARRAEVLYAFDR